MRGLAATFMMLASVSMVAAQDAALEQAIDEPAQKWMEVWNSGDAAGFTSLYTEDADSVGYEGDTRTGRTALVEGLGESMNYYKGSSIALVRTGTHVVSPDVVVTDGTWEVKGGANPDNAPTKGHYTFILVKEGDAFRIAGHRAKVPPPAN